MFFIGIFGLNSKVVPAGEISGTTCPVCGESGSFHLCRQYDYFHAFFLPLFRYHTVYIATCPACASVFALRQELGKAAEHGEPVQVTSADLSLLKSNYARYCPVCGAKQASESLYCNQCGAKL